MAVENPPGRAKAMLYWYPVWCHSLVDWELLNADSSWIALLEDDLTMALVLQGATHLRDPREQVEWLDLGHPGEIDLQGMHARQRTSRNLLTSKLQGFTEGAKPMEKEHT